MKRGGGGEREKMVQYEDIRNFSHCVTHTHKKKQQLSQSHVSVVSRYLQMSDLLWGRYVGKKKKREER